VKVHNNEWQGVGQVIGLNCSKGDLDELLGKGSDRLVRWSRNGVGISLLSGLCYWLSQLLINSSSSSPLPSLSSASVFLVSSLILGFLPMHVSACLYCCSPLSLPFSKGLRSPGGLRSQGPEHKVLLPLFRCTFVTLEQCLPLCADGTHNPKRSGWFVFCFEPHPGWWSASPLGNDWA